MSQNYIKAYYWYEEASDSGNLMAKYRMESLEKTNKEVKEYCQNRFLNIKNLAQAELSAGLKAGVSSQGGFTKHIGNLFGEE